MKRLVLATLIATSVASATAEWRSTVENSSAVHYIDTETIHKVGQRRKFWSITDFKEQQNGGIYSILVRQEYDCEEEKSRILYMATFSEKMAGNGRIADKTFTENEMKWEEIPPDTVARKKFKAICIN